MNLNGGKLSEEEAIEEESAPEAAAASVAPAAKEEERKKRKRNLCPEPRLQLKKGRRKGRIRKVGKKRKRPKILTHLRRSVQPEILTSAPPSWVFPTWRRTETLRAGN